MKRMLKIGIHELINSNINNKYIFHRLKRFQYNHYKPLQNEIGNLRIILGGPYHCFIHHDEDIKTLDNYGRNSTILFIDESHYTKYKDVVNIVNKLNNNKTRMEFIFKESQNIIENNCINRFSQNTSFKKMISKSLLMNNNCLPKSVYGLNFINDDNYKMKIHFTGLDYDNGIENNVFNYYKTEQCKEYKPILTSGSFISSYDKEFVSYYKPNQLDNIDYLNEVVYEFLETIRDNRLFNYDGELYWKTHFICNVAKISTRKKETIDIPKGITIDETIAFLDEIK